eukprot:1991176-Alexandrium_andersonii.AAC.1
MLWLASYHVPRPRARHAPPPPSSSPCCRRTCSALWRHPPPWPGSGREWPGTRWAQIFATRTEGASVMIG